MFKYIALYSAFLLLYLKLLKGLYVPKRANLWKIFSKFLLSNSLENIIEKLYAKPAIQIV